MKRPQLVRAMQRMEPKRYQNLKPVMFFGPSEQQIEIRIAAALGPCLEVCEKNAFFRGQLMRPIISFHVIGEVPNIQH